jgi:hypothetical protein
VPSTDGRSNDELASLSDDDGDFEDNESSGYLDESPQYLSPPASESTVEASTTIGYASPEQSIMTSSAETQPGEPTYLNLEETAREGDAGVADIQGIVRDFTNESELPDVLRAYGSPQIRLSVVASVSQRRLPIYASFRVLYVGMLDQWAITHTNNHIGAALHATPSSSRFNIVQDSSFKGSPSSSKVQLEPAGSELVVDHCTSPGVEADQKGNIHAIITLDDGQKIKFGPSGSITPETAPLPDLIIIGHGGAHADEHSTVPENKHRLVRNILKQHGIPIIEIAVVRPYGSEPFTFQTGDLRLSFEGRNGPGDEFEVLKSLPVDLYTFLSLDPAQLNRHLYFLNERSATTKSPPQAKPKGRKGSLRESSSKSTCESSKHAMARLKELEWPPKWKLVMHILPAMLAIILIAIGSSAIPGHVKSVYDSGVSVRSHTAPSTAPLETIPTPLMSASKTATPPPSAVSPLLVSKNAVLSSRGKPRSGWLDRAMPRRSDTLDHVNFTVTGNHQVVFCGLQNMSGPIAIEVERNSEPVPYRLVSSDPRALVLRLDQRYPPSTFVVHMKTSTRPVSHRVFEVKLGTNESALFSTLHGLTAVSESIKHELAVAQTNIKDLSSQASKGLQAALTYLGEGSSTVLEGHVEKAKKLASYKLGQGQTLSSKSLQHLKDSPRYISARASTVSHNVASQLWAQSRPLRTAPALLKTRERALQIRCNVEKTFGAKNTRSCRLLGDIK